MTKKERRRLASELAKYEIIIQGSTDEKARRQAEEQVMKLTAKVTNFDDMEAIDALVPDLMKKIIDEYSSMENK